MICIYHADCADGFTAAWVVHMLHPEATFVAARHGDAPPDVTGQDVIVVDFSYPRETLLLMKEKALSLRVLDHHKTAKEALADLDFCTFDMARSGAGLAWDEFHPGVDRPALVDYVEDRDLWRNSLRRSREVNSYIASKQSEFFADWYRLSHEITYNFDWVVSRGETALDVKQQYVRDVAKLARLVTIQGPPAFPGPVPVVNAAHVHISDVLNELADKTPSEMALGWFVTEKGDVKVSLRSMGFTDTTPIAKHFGGGGHRNASGFTLDLKKEDHLQFFCANLVGIQRT